MAVITISRQFGAGGRTLGKMLAEKFGYTFADQNIIQMIAEHANVSPHWVENIENEAGTRLSKVISRMVSKNLVHKILADDSGYIDEQLYLDYLVVMIAQLAEEGNVVIIGRGSQYILNDHPDAFHILMVDDFENRVKFMEKNYNLSNENAVSTVKREDRRRTNLYRKIRKTDYDDPVLYHMTLNMGRVDMQKAMELICDLMGE
ncbi:cytidylate kinase-like family protein [Desulfobacterales bacterium HSG16]|nr:cytidylate kinase-like family protein [Desulfobacterales bacterium HSG16]